MRQRQATIPGLGPWVEMPPLWEMAQAQARPLVVVIVDPRTGEREGVTARNPEHAEKLRRVAAFIGMRVEVE